MEVYILDSLLRREHVVDSFESLIWTERWSEIGDFELRLPSTLASRSLFRTGVQLAMNESYRVMTVETVEDATDEDGESILTVKGRSLEAFLEDRVAKLNITPITEAESTFRIYGAPQDIAQNLFYEICVQGVLSDKDIMPFWTFGSFLHEGNLPYPLPVELEMDVGSLYDVIKSICDSYEMGFRLVREKDDSKLYFNVYTGIDRTVGQPWFNPVVFSPDFENLQNTTELVSTEDYKNVAYAFSPTAMQVVYSDDSLYGIAGFERKAIFLRVDDPPGVGPNPPSLPEVLDNLQARGKEELAKYTKKSIFDGEMNQNSTYKYQVDYNLGDKVELRNVDGIVSTRRITEQIFVSDSEGERSYPTLSEGVK